MVTHHQATPLTTIHLIVKNQRNQYFHHLRLNTHIQLQLNTKNNQPIKLDWQHNNKINKPNKSCTRHGLSVFKHETNKHIF